MRKRPKSWDELSFLGKLYLHLNPFAKVKWMEKWLDFYEVETLPTVYHEVTGGALSYPAYEADDVIEFYERNVSQEIEYAIDNFIEDNELDKDREWVR